MGSKLKFSNGRLFINDDEIHFKNIELLDQLESGANGFVFKARDVLLDRSVCVKIWVKMKTKDTRDKFQQGIAEAQKIAQLYHNNIVQIYSADSIKDKYFYTIMEFIEGVTLNKYLETNPSIENRETIWMHIYNALNYSHSQNVFHGDLHGDNILVLKNHAKIIDFGTSIFTTGTTNRMKRESKFIYGLIGILFPEYLYLIPINHGKINVKILLSDILNWLNIFNSFEIFSRTTDPDDYAYKKLIFDISTETSQCTIIDFEDVINLQRKKTIPDKYIKMFLDNLISYVKIEDEINTVEIVYNLNESIEEKVKKYRQLQSETT